jgi:23S rRNA (uracil1939-C5)-methyltransferase
MPIQKFHIEKHIHGGVCLSHDSHGKVTLFEGAIAGEDVTAKIYSSNKSLQKGRTTLINNRSPDRVQPACKYFKQCGGCDFQHMRYSRQLLAKEEILKDLLVRSGHSTLACAAEELLTTPLASDKVFHYRQRIRLQVDASQTLGFFKRRSNDCVAVDSCLLARQEINDCLESLRQQQAFTRLLARAEALELLFNPATRLITLVIHLTQKPRPADNQHAKILAEEIIPLEHIFFCGKGFAPNGKSTLSFSIPPAPPYTNTATTLAWETGGFCQVNLEQNQKLIQTVLAYCNATETASVLDLFCGMGNFSIPLAMRAKSVLGIEGQASAIRSARKNSSNAGQTNTTFTKQPVHDACVALAKDGEKFTIVVIDPPRQGVPGLTAQLAQLTNKRLVYVSCDPATLCRDLAELLNNGFHLTRLQPIDMFPQTHHIECVALLEKRPENH